MGPLRFVATSDRAEKHEALEMRAQWLKGGQCLIVSGTLSLFARIIKKGEGEPKLGYIDDSDRVDRADDQLSVDEDGWGPGSASDGGDSA